MPVYRRTGETGSANVAEKSLQPVPHQFRRAAAGKRAFAAM
ncbi:hypothetical protein [Saccharopolyspora phatthalungensis]|uniref:Uncharacterized protein n=1 Tax=Saccharopolyspora phatthalungensis TaxID=664693 RepID=A0A840Q633_9PSEU|nr:hypothetical protein [Saccharopolyspora phatthalungensis]MBB5157972.1 hypothetical protein [Saccharopolyspora phatthalungensis]